jgi:reactive intermediate/imine deaminase
MHPSAGTYSHAVRAGGLLFVSGQAPLDETGEVPTSRFRDQAELTFDNLEKVVVAGGGTLDRIVRLGVYLTSLDDFAELNEVMRERFTEPFPARTTIEIAFPRFLIEVDAIVALD